MANNLTQIPSTIVRRAFIISASALALTGCSGIVGPPEASSIYGLHTNPAPLPGLKVDWALGIGIPDSSNSLDTDRIALTHNDNTADYYANAVWSDRLPELVQTTVLAAFQGSGRINAVARDQDALHVDYVLNMDIRDFSAHYEAAAGSAPSVIVTLVAQMTTARGRKIISTFTANQSAPATADSVDAVVKALNTALAAAIQAILGWAFTIPALTVAKDP
jgi:cholesterol transport system auxiliary component